METKTKTKTYKIAVIPGDGTGPEVVQEGLKVLDCVAGQAGFGGYQGILLDAERGVYQGASDNRKDGCALGY